MYIDPDIAAILAAADPDAKDFWELSPQEARRAMDEMADAMLLPVPVSEITDLRIPTRAGTVAARLYRPDGSTASELLVFFHGGGWEIGSVDNADRPVRRLANDSGMSILSVDYRLAPEHPFPAPLEDCYDATVWAANHLTDLGVDGSFVAVGGDSAGGNLAAAVTQLIRDQGGPPLHHQLLVYPVVTRHFDSASYEAFADGYFLTRATMQAFWNLYIGSAAAPAYADLYAAGNLDGLPPATVITCGLDPLRDEGEQYAARLSEAGVPATTMRVEGLLHGSWYMDASGRRAYQFGLDIAGALRRAAARPPNQS